MIESKTLIPPLVCVVNLSKEVYDVVGLAEIVLNVIVLRRDAEFDKLVFERAGLLKEAVGLSFYFHSDIFFLSTAVCLALFAVFVDFFISPQRNRAYLIHRTTLIASKNIQLTVPTSPATADGEVIIRNHSALPYSSSS